VVEAAWSGLGDEGDRSTLEAKHKRIAELERALGKKDPRARGKALQGSQ